MQIGLAVGDVRGPATPATVLDQVRVAAGAGFATAWSSQVLGWDALTTIAVAGWPVPRMREYLTVLRGDVCVTDTAADVRARIAEQFALAAQVPEYRATLGREGAAGPQDVAIVGTETEVAQALTQFREQGRTVDFPAELAR